MKKIVLTFLILGSFVLANAEYTKEDRARDMQVMEDSLAEIQKGFLYSNGDLVKSGLKALRDKISTIEPPVGNTLFTKEETFAYRYAKKQQEKIDKFAQGVEDYFFKGERNQALGEYTKILKECMSCHVKLRKK
jgi:hypothetical protein